MGIVGGGRRAKPFSSPVLPETPQSTPWLFLLGHPSKHSILRYSHDPERDSRILKKSWDLLLAHLDPKQTRDLVTYGRFTVTRRGGTKVVIVANGDQINVQGTSIYGKTTKYCTMTHVPVPIWDLILSQLLAVKHNWKWFKDMAVKY